MSNIVKKLYVMVLPQMDENMEFCYSIKFGYSKDFDKVRKPQYQAYFWNIKILHTYEDGDTDIEARIKYHLKDYILFGTEWFKYCDEVLDFFNENDTYEKLKAVADSVILPDTTAKDKKYAKNEVNFNLVSYVYKEIFNKEVNIEDRVKKNKDLIDILRRYSPENQIKFIISTYSIDQDDLEKYLKGYEKDYIEIAPKIKELAELFNKQKDEVSRLKFIVNLEEENLSKEELKLFFSLIADKYADYFNVLGFSGIKACKCQESYVKRKVNDIFGNLRIDDTVKNEIYRLFEVGKRYVKADIKATLKNLYERLGYNKTAKASDLEEYFEVKGILTSDKKAGFELLAKK